MDKRNGNQPSESVADQLREASKIGKSLREKLFEIGQASMELGNSDLRVMDDVFRLIKQSEVLRREIDALASSRRAPAAGQRKIQHSGERESFLDRGEYPRYSLRDGSVVKTALGANGLEYEHSVKLEDLEKILDAINEFAGSNGFAVDEVLKKLNLPSYLTYLVISLLKERLGKLESPRRGRYRFKELGEALNFQSLIAEVQDLEG